MPVIAGHYVVAYANSAGFTGGDLITITAIAKIESNWNTDYHFTGPETDQRGLWAINAWDHPEFNRVQLYDPTYNAWAARQLFVKAGMSWTPWQSFLDHTYIDAEFVAEQAVAEFQGYGGDPTTSNAPPYTPGPIVVNQGLYPNFGPFDPAPYIRHLGDVFNDWGNGINNLVRTIRGIIR